MMLGYSYFHFTLLIWFCTSLCGVKKAKALAVNTAKVVTLFSGYTLDITRWREYIYVIYRAGGPYGKKLCPRLSTGRTQDQGHSFSHTDRPSPVNDMFIFFPAVNWFYRLLMLFTQLLQLLSLNRLARRLLTICKKSWQRANNSDSRKRKMY